MMNWFEFLCIDNHFLINYILFALLNIVVRMFRFSSIWHLCHFMAICEIEFRTNNPGRNFIQHDCIPIPQRGFWKVVPWFCFLLLVCFNCYCRKFDGFIIINFSNDRIWYVHKTPDVNNLSYIYKHPSFSISNPAKSPDFNESRILSPPLRMLAKLNVTN